MALTQRNLFFFSVFLILTTIHCDRFLFWEDDSPVPANPGQLNPGSTLSAECQFYKIQSLIVDCYANNRFFTEAIEERKNIIASLCAKQAFSTVWGTNFTPSLPSEKNAGNNGFRWGFVWGSIQKGNPPPSHLHPLELSYYNLLITFKYSVDAHQLNACLGGNYHFDGPTIIDTSRNMINLGMLESETFVKCYKEQLNQYRVKHSCATLTAPQNL